MITVKEALQIGRLSEATILAGAKGLDRQFKTVTIMDISTITEWLTGYELVISGVTFEANFTKPFIQDLIAKNIAGLVTKKKFILSADPDLLDFCNTVGFPIILAPSDCSWTSVMNPLLERIISQPFLIIQESQAFHAALMKPLVEGLSLDEICKFIEREAGLKIAIADVDYRLLGASANFDWPFFMKKLFSQNHNDGEVYFENLSGRSIQVHKFKNLETTDIGYSINSYPIIFSQKRYCHVLIAIPDSDPILEPLTLAMIEETGMAAAIRIKSQTELASATQRFKALIIDRFLSSENLSRQESINLLSPLDKKLSSEYVSVHFRYKRQFSINSFLEWTERIDQFRAKIENDYRTKDFILLAKDGTEIALIPADSSDKMNDIKNLKKEFLDFTKLSHIFVGVGRPAALESVGSSIRESVYASQYAELITDETNPHFYEEMGAVRYFLDSPENFHLEIFESSYSRYITRLVNYDLHNNTDLLRTLETYFKNERSKVRTEKELFIHKNTLRARLSSIEKICECDLSNLRYLIDIDTALKIKPYFDGLNHTGNK